MARESSRQVHGTKSAAHAHVERLVFRLALTAVVTIQLAGRSADAFFIDERQSPHTSTWDYDNQKNWRRQYKTCNQNAQSPIDIKSHWVTMNNHLNLHFYNYDQFIKFKLQNAHHTIKMEPIGPAYDTNRYGRFSPSDILSAADEYLDPSWRAKLAEHTQTQPSHGPQQQQQLRPNINSNSQHYSNDNNSDGTTNKRLIQSSSPRPISNSNNNNDSGRPQQQRPANGYIGSNNHNTNQLINDDDIDGGQKLPYNGAPSIKLDWLDDGYNVFKLRDIHFHWAERKDNGSEHAIDGVRAAMEMHLVHIRQGVNQSDLGLISDSVVVIAVLIDAKRKSSADFNPIVSALTSINMTDQPKEIEYKNIYDLLPSTLNTFWTYSGSLTTPPCYEVVNWVVMSERLYMSSKQIEEFRNIYAPPERTGAGGHNDMSTVSSSSSSPGHYRPPPHNGVIHGEDNPSHPTAHNNKHKQAGDDDDDDGDSLSSSSTDNHNNYKPPVPIMPNIRQLQPLNMRVIMASFAPGNRLSPGMTAYYSSAQSQYSAIRSSQGSLYFSNCTIIMLIFTSLLLHLLHQLLRK